MKSRMEKYYEDNHTEKRADKNMPIYDDIYSQKSELESNVTVFDNVNEIDVNKIKDLINSREEYKKISNYQSIINKESSYKNENINYDFDEPESKNYDINEILENKRSNQDFSLEQTRVRKISNTQYDILKGLNLNQQEVEEEMDTDFFTQKTKLKTLIDTIIKEEKNDEEKTSLDLFENLKSNNTTNLTPSLTEIKEQKVTEETFYTSKQDFEKDDFEDSEEKSQPVKNSNFLMKMLVIVLILLIIAIIFVILSGFIDFAELYKTLLG